jgi:hypothetical protein
MSKLSLARHWREWRLVAYLRHLLAYSQHGWLTVRQIILGGLPMSRKANEERIEKLKTAIETHPGEKAGFFARLLGWPHEVVSRALVELNDRGIFLSEDERGGLWSCDSTAQK